MKLPRVVGLVLCRSMTFDPEAGGHTLTGVFNTLVCPSWPSPPQQFMAFAGLQGGRGEGTIELVIQRMATEQRVYRFRRWYTLPDPQLVSSLELPIRRCVFPAPGRYGVSLRFEGSELTSRTLDVRSPMR